MLEEIVKGRMGMYCFLSSVLLNIPSRDFLEDLMKGKVGFPEIGEIKEGVEIIREFAANFSDVEEIERAIRQEYTAVFIGPFSDYVSPYQSTYEGENPYGPVTLRIKEKYKKFGYKYDYNEPADHIGVELAFMAESCREFLNGNKDELIKQNEMLNEIEGWVFKFCEKIEKHPEAKFYRGIAKILKNFIRFDKNILKELIALI